MTPRSREPQASPAPPPVTTPADARRLADSMLDTMNALLAVIERETELVRAGKIREGMSLEKQKSELSRRYAGAINHFKNSKTYMTQSTPELLAALQRHHDVFRAMLQVNLTVLATAHAVSEGIVRGVNAEAQRRSVPQTYTASGQRSAPPRQHTSPIAVSRSL
ncbi:MULTISPECIES: hypothetical protein [unclassified Nitrobacter]|uniref:hypothetical protein n=1 Tax=unclassified Nitrobacter TaxID=2620411 RepID=UPI000926F4F6|nr:MULTISPECIES: hypothetical protein [unclassified Nitrobacter]MBN9148277.1 hypothetical protein [Nitrobacter sp.]OJV01307.1 MAG: hypothetical protein BGO16_04820 [Nitrobacter sp. 62-23]